MLRLVNLKESIYTVDYAIKTIEIEVEQAKREGLIAIKILHGYGSHGRGGTILKDLRRILPLWKRQGFIVNFFGGDKWSLFDEDSKEILNKDKTIFGDEDIDHNNPGITIIQVNK